MPDAEFQAEQFANPMPTPQETQLALPGMMALPKEIIILFLDATRSIEELRHNLAGEILETYQDAEGNLYQKWVEKGMRRMNDDGIRFTTSLLSTYITPTTATSILSEERIMAICLRFYQSFNALLRAKGEEFAIDSNYKETLLNSVADMVEFALRKAKDGATLKALTQAYQVRELKGYGQEKKGLQLSDLSPLNMIRGG